ncbi:MAG: energy-coupled thiamine transporter ThiT [Eubacterium sp.]|nr:energy-coupled thiamine transporter ThiT [Eubacterium sp.]
MFQFFTMPAQDAYGVDAVTLTHAGFYAVAALIAALVVTALVMRPKAERAKGITTKQLVFSAAAMALGTVASMIKFADLPMGGSITLFSMLFIVLIGHWYGAKIGITTAVAYGLLQFILQPVFYTLPQVLIDYPLAFGALGISGFFRSRKNGLVIGYLAAVLGRYFFAFLSGMIFFGAYAADYHMSIPAYSLSYNAMYLFPEAALTIAALYAAPVKNALARIRRIAVEAPHRQAVM